MPRAAEEGGLFPRAEAAAEVHQEPPGLAARQGRRRPFRRQLLLRHRGALEERSAVATHRRGSHGGRIPARLVEPEEAGEVGEGVPGRPVERGRVLRVPQLLQRVLREALLARGGRRPAAHRGAAPKDRREEQVPLEEPPEEDEFLDGARREGGGTAGAGADGPAPGLQVARHREQGRPRGRRRPLRDRVRAVRAPRHGRGRHRERRASGQVRDDARVRPRVLAPARRVREQSRSAGPA